MKCLNRYIMKVFKIMKEYNCIMLGAFFLLCGGQVFGAEAEERDRPEGFTVENFEKLQRQLSGCISIIEELKRENAALKEQLGLFLVPQIRCSGQEGGAVASNNEPGALPLGGRIAKPIQVEESCLSRYIKLAAMGVGALCVIGAAVYFIRGAGISAIQKKGISFTDFK